MKFTVQNGIRSALYYKGKYFLPPDDFDSAEAFLTALAQQKLPVVVKAVLLQENCKVDVYSSYELGVSIAPYFITDYINGHGIVRIDDASDVWPTQVELLSQQQYNDRLREKVLGFCAGCRNFGGLTQNDSSLSGHFSEISLNGVCFYRYESRTAPYRLWLKLNSLPYAWKRDNYSGHSAETVLIGLKYGLGLKYDSAEIAEENGVRTLRLSVKKSSLILTAVTDLVSDFVRAHVDDHYRLALTGRVEAAADGIAQLLSEKKIASTRKELKKYGVAIGILEYDAQREAAAASVVDEMAQSGLLRILAAEPGRKICLFSSEPHALMQLRYASPVLQPCGTKIIMYGADGTRAYTISFDMKPATIDLAPAEPEKARKISKRIQKLEEKRALSREQARNLLTYVENRLSDAGCDHTLRFTQQWLTDNLPPERHRAAMEEILGMGGGCDCEVAMNCYDDYELDD